MLSRWGKCETNPHNPGRLTQGETGRRVLNGRTAVLVCVGVGVEGGSVGAGGFTGIRIVPLVTKYLVIHKKIMRLRTYQPKKKHNSRGAAILNWIIAVFKIVLCLMTIHPYVKYEIDW